MIINKDITEYLELYKTYMRLTKKENKEKEYELTLGRQGERNGNSR